MGFTKRLLNSITILAVVCALKCAVLVIIIIIIISLYWLLSKLPISGWGVGRAWWCVGFLRISGGGGGRRRMQRKQGGRVCAVAVLPFQLCQRTVVHGHVGGDPLVFRYRLVVLGPGEYRTAARQHAAVVAAQLSMLLLLLWRRLLLGNRLLVIVRSCLATQRRKHRTRGYRAVATSSSSSSSSSHECYSKLHWVRVTLTFDPAVQKWELINWTELNVYWHACSKNSWIAEYKIIKTVWSKAIQ